MADYGYATWDDMDRRATLITDARLYLNRSVDCMQGDVLDNVATVRLLASVCGRCDQPSDAIKHYENAYNMLPDHEAEGHSEQEHEKIKSIRVEILTEKASALATLEQIDEALQTFNEARRLHGEEPLAGTILDNITLLFIKEDETDGRRLMEVLKSWSEKERNSWFTYLFVDWVPINGVARLQRAAKSTGETDLLIGWLTALAKTLPAQSLHLFNIRGAIAHIYYPMLGDVEKGKTLRQELLTTKTKPDPAYEDTMNETRTRHRMQLADILFYEFQTTADPAKKEEIMEALRLLPSAHDDEGDDKHIRESHVDMLRANMLRIMGPAKEYQRYMDELFRKCIAGLEDSVSWNDLSSLRLLSKVLASLDSLEHDARIAISAQFSVLDRAIHGQDTESEQSETTSDKDVGETNAGPDAGSDAELDAGQDTAREDGPLATSEVVRNDSPTDEVHNKKVKDITEEPLEETQSPAELEGPDTGEPEAGELDEDLTGGGVYCDGQCGVDIYSWTRPIYYCLVCPSCDLCEDCHSKRLKQTKGELEEPWLSFCGANHRYIKGPMKGWKGIRNGAIRYRDTEITVTEWLRGLKEERWPNAWKIFWTRQGGLKDIGVED